MQQCTVIGDIAFGGGQGVPTRSICAPQITDYFFCHGL